MVFKIVRVLQVHSCEQYKSHSWLGLLRHPQSNFFMSQFGNNNLRFMPMIDIALTMRLR